MKQKEKFLFFEDGVIWDNKLWFVSSYKNGLFYIDLETSAIHFVGLIPYEKSSKVRITVKILKWQDELLLIPMAGRDVYGFNIKTGSWRIVSKLPLHSFRNSERKFCDAEIFDTKLFLFGCSLPGVVIVDLQHDEEHYLYQSIYPQEQNYEIFAGYCNYREDNLIYIPLYCCNAVIIYDMKAMSYEIKVVGEKNDKYSGMTRDTHGDFWLLPRNGNQLIKWNGEEIREKILIDKEKRGKDNFLGVYQYDNKLYLPAMGDNSSVLIDSGKIILIDNKEYILFRKIDNENLLVLFEDGQVEILKNGSTRYSSIINKEQLRISQYAIKNCIKNYKEILIEDSDIITLERFIDNL